MAPPSFDFYTAQRWCILFSLVLTASVIWPNAMDSAVAKMPVFVLGAASAATLLMSAILRNGRLQIPIGAMGPILLTHLALFLLSAWGGFDPIYTWNAFLFGISSLLVFWVASRAYSTREHVTVLLRAISWLTAGLCTVGMLQYFGIGLFSFAFSIGLDKRIPSLLGNSGAFGSYLVVVAPLLLAQALATPFSTKSSVIHFGLLGVVIPVLLLTQTRSSIIAFVVSTAVFVLLTVRARRLAPVILMATLVLAGVVVLGALVRPDLGARFSHMFSEGPKSSFARRLYFWQAGKDAFLASPVVGHGTGSYERIVFDYRSPDYWMVLSEDIVPHAHNELIEIGVEYGAIGLLLSLATVALVVHRGLTVVRSGKDWEKWMAAGIISAIAGVAIDNLANVTLRLPSIALLVWLLMGLLFSQAFSTRTEQTLTLPFRLPAWTVAVPWLLWALLAVLFGKAQLNAIDADVHMGEAMLCRERHDTPAATMGYQSAVNANPKNLMARWHLAQAYLDEFQWENALHSTEDLQKLSPRYPQSSLMKAFALYHLERYAEALVSIEQELRQRSHPFSWLVQSAIYRAIGNEDGERDAIVHLLRKDIEAKQLFAYRSCCQRLIQLSRFEDQSREDSLLFNALEALIPGEHDFFASLLRQRETHQPLSGQ